MLVRQPVIGSYVYKVHNATVATDYRISKPGVRPGSKVSGEIVKSDNQSYQSSSSLLLKQCLQCKSMYKYVQCNTICLKLAAGSNTAKIYLTFAAAENKRRERV